VVRHHPTSPALVCALALALPAAARLGSPPPSRASQVLDLAAVDLLELPAIDPAALRARDDAAASRSVLRYAEPHAVALTPRSSGTWQTVAGGSRLWRLRIFAPGATDLNLAFTRYELPPGATLHVASESDAAAYEGPYDERDGGPRHELWTPVVPGDRAVVELRVPAAAKFEPVLELTAVNRGYRDLFHLASRSAAAIESGACNVDVLCPEGEAWRDERRSVGLLSLGGTAICSGMILNNTAADCRPFFLTAAHCGATPANAASAVVYWNYQASLCRGPRDGDLGQNQTGAQLRAALAGPDFALLELLRPPDPSRNLIYSGWDARAATAPGGGVCIHHPSSDEKAISIDLDPLSTADSCIGGTVPGSHWQVGNWEQGTTEIPGSSGGGLWDPATHLLIGQLSGGTASCTANESSCFGKLALAWDLGASADTRLRDWLDPLGTGTRSLSGRSCGDVCFLEVRRNRSTDSCLADPANDNSVWEPGEEVEIQVDVRAIGDATQVRGTLTSNTSGIDVVDDTVTFRALQNGDTATSDPPHFRVKIGPGVPCYTVADFTVAVAAAQGGPWVSTFSHPVGQPPSGGPDPIPDQATVTSPLVVPDTFLINDLDVHVVIDHTWVGDLKIDLVSPAGTTVTLLDRPGDPAQGNGCPDDNMDVTFDDAATVLLEDHCAGTDPWYAGRALPVMPLLAFAGENVNGTWRLVVSDNAGADVGDILSWSVLTDPPLASGTCRTCGTACSGTEVAVNTLRATKTANGDVVLSLPAGPTSACASGLQVRMAGTARPATGSGSFPGDPRFADVTAEDSDPGADFRHAPPGASAYYKVVEDLGGAPGPSGSYGF
jgi:subtilisin-like proprotein convertase family protein